MVVLSKFYRPKPPYLVKSCGHASVFNNLTSVVNIGYLCYTLGITVACVLFCNADDGLVLYILGRLLSRTKRYCQSLTIINAGFVFDDQLRVSVDGGYRRFLTPESIIDRYQYNDSKINIQLVMSNFHSSSIPSSNRFRYIQCKCPVYAFRGCHVQLKDI